VTVFDPEVVYPKPALPLAELPPDLLDYFKTVFTEDRREAFPAMLLDEQLWVRRRGPAVAVLQPSRTIHGQVTATVIFETQGRIVVAALQHGKLRVLHHDGQAYLREDGTQVATGHYNPQLRYRLQGKKTLLAQGNQLVVIDGQTTRHGVDRFGNLPILDATEHSYYWVEGGRLLRSDALVDQRPIGEVLPNRTLMWAGPNFGLGFWYAGELQQGFVFDARRPGLNSTLKLDRLPGQLLGATAVFDADRAWLLVQYQEGGKTYHRATAVNQLGQVLAQYEIEEPSEDHWLRSIHGHAAIGGRLFCATDDGVVAVQVKAGQFITRQFPDTAPFVNSNSKLLALVEDKQIALLVVGERQIVRLAISQ
jgi:hypothetical protein